MNRFLILLAASSLSYTGLDLLTSMILSRALGPTVIGDLSLLTSFASFFAVLGTFGFVQANVIHFSNKGSDIASFRALALLLGLSTVLLTAIFIVAFKFLPASYSAQAIYGISNAWFAYLYVVLHVFLIFATSYLLAFKANYHFSFTSIVYSLIVFTIALITFIFKDSLFGFSYVVILYCIAKFFAIFYAIFYLRSNVSRNNIADGNVGFNYSSARSFYYYNAMQQLVSFVPFILYSFYLYDSEALGYFTRALSVTLLITLVPLSLGPHLFSRWAHSANEQRKQLPRIVMGYVAICFLLMPVIYVFSKQIVVLLYGAGFEQSSVYLEVLLISSFFRIVYDPFLNALSAMKLQQVNFAIMLVSLMVLIGSSIALDFTVPSLGVAYAVAISNAIVFVLCVSAYLFFTRSATDDK